MAGCGVAVVDNGGECRFGSDLSRDKQSGWYRDQGVQSESHLGRRQGRLFEMRHARRWPLTTSAERARRLCHEAGGELEQIQFLLGL
jgi:hypothetical protein